VRVHQWVIGLSVALVAIIGSLTLVQL